jgi:hypothetical protein
LRRPGQPDATQATDDARLAQARRWLRGGMTGRSYDAKFADKSLRVWTYEMPDGKLEQYQVAIKE